jgi:hypothetical protein
MSIGGYFELEFRKGYEYHKDAIRLNSGRNALLLILKIKNFSKIYLPRYICQSLVNALHGIDFEFYSINNQLESVFDFSIMKENDAFLYVNYFGLKDSFVSSIDVHNLIVDNSQSFYSLPLPGIDTFYSPRKFFGVPDGAYLYSNIDCYDFLPVSESHNNCEHLLLRLDSKVKEGYDSYSRYENTIQNKPISMMSNLTRRILDSIDYYGIAEIRRSNFKFLHSELSGNFKLEKDQVPMIYPYYTQDKSIKSRLLSSGIFTANYWSECNLDVSNNLIALPIDQRYNIEDMKKIVKIIHEVV